MKTFLRYALSYFVPVGAVLAAWEVVSRTSPKNAFMFSSPLRVIALFIKDIGNGSFLRDFVVTFWEASAGLLLGILCGVVIGLVLLCFRRLGKVAGRYLVLLSSVPIFAIAPMMIVWFGVGFPMKVATVFFSVVFVVICQTYEGGLQVTDAQARFFKSNNASKMDALLKLHFPAAMMWIIQSLKISTNLAVLGAFIGEFIASEEGLGHRVIKSSSLYDVDSVLVGIVGMVLIIVAFSVFVYVVERNKIAVVRFFSLVRMRDGVSHESR